jgi:hypothetical protein
MHAKIYNSVGTSVDLLALKQPEGVLLDIRIRGGIHEDHLAIVLRRLLLLTLARSVWVVERGL